MVPLRISDREVLVESNDIHLRGAMAKIRGGSDGETPDFSWPPHE